jgi:GINS complex subunit 4
MDLDWGDIDDNFDRPIAGPSFIERARDAPDDEDWVAGEAPRAAIIPQETAEETSLQKLIRYWMNERHAPDILPPQETLLGRLLDHIRKQVRWFLSIAFVRHRPLPVFRTRRANGL